ncbi:MAG: helix-turn-helix domain-containing protein [Verrucomicrobiota bacterium]
MPWEEVTGMDQREKFVVLAQSERYTISELCESYGISRKTGYKWLRRYAEGGIGAMKERSRAPRRVPSRTERALERLMISERRKHSTSGGKKTH